MIITPISRQKNQLEQELTLLDDNKREMGRIYVLIKFKTHRFEDKVFWKIPQMRFLDRRRRSQGKKDLL